MRSWHRPISRGLDILLQRNFLGFIMVFHRQFWLLPPKLDRNQVVKTSSDNVNTAELTGDGKGLVERFFRGARLA